MSGHRVKVVVETSFPLVFRLRTVELYRGKSRNRGDIYKGMMCRRILSTVITGYRFVHNVVAADGRKYMVPPARPACVLSAMIFCA